MRKTILGFFFILISGSAALAHPPGSPKFFWSCENGKLTLTLSIDTGTFVPDSSPTDDVKDSRVTIFTIANPNTLQVRADSVKLPQESAEIDSSIHQTLTIVYKKRCDDPANPPFDADRSYFLEVAPAAFNPQPAKAFDTELKFNSAQIVSARSVYDLNDVIRVQTAGTRWGPPDSKVTFTRSQLKVSKDRPDIEKGSSAISAKPCASAGQPLPPGHYGLEEQFCLEQNLRAGEEYQLKVDSGLRTTWGQPVKASGTLKPAAAPKPEDAKITGSLGMSAAEHQKAVFTLTGKYAPLHKFGVLSDKFPAFPDPSLDVDVGLRSTQSKNAITTSLLYRFYPLIGSPGPRPGSADFNCSQANAGNYCRWRETPWNRLTGLPWAFGGRTEVDRDFHRLNLLGVGRLDLHFYRWMGAVSDQKARIQSMLKNAGEFKPLLTSLDGPHYGFSLVPYVELNAGGHANDETLTNKGQSVNVPRHAIFRFYAGLNPCLEVYRWRFAADEALVELAHQEQIGVTTSSGVQLFKISGIHHHGQASIEYFLDPDRHYSFGVKYENGRAAPNFNYLNKFSAGMNFVY